MSVSSGAPTVTGCSRFLTQRERVILTTALTRKPGAPAHSLASALSTFFLSVCFVKAFTRSCAACA
jgi:hypothetical protein